MDQDTTERIVAAHLASALVIAGSRKPSPLSSEAESTSALYYRCLDALREERGARHRRNKAAKSG
jgi:hypothetical protein